MWYPSKSFMLTMFLFIIFIIKNKSFNYIHIFIKLIVLFVIEL